MTSSFPSQNTVASMHSASSHSEDIIDGWVERLRKYRSHLETDPQSIPIKQLAFDISRSLESGEIERSKLAEIGKILCDRALLIRADRTRKFLGGLNQADRTQRFKNIVLAEAEENGERISFEAFAKKWSNPRHGIVFTAHPTFLMTTQTQDILVKLIDSEAEETDSQIKEILSDIVHESNSDISLKDEHDQVQKAILNAQQAAQKLIDIVLETAKELYPQDWYKLNPSVIRIYSWVGYDLDGRTDIRWFDSIRFRLDEKLRQVDEYRRILACLGKVSLSDKSVSLLGTLDDILVKEQELLKHINQEFAKDLDVPANLVRAANALTGSYTEGEQLSLGTYVSKIIDLLNAQIKSLDDTREMMELVRLRARFSARGLSTAHMHFRVNAAQLNNALRTQLDEDESNLDLSSYMLQNFLDEKILNMKNSEADKVNFASVALEKTTAIRQFMIISQILKHIDSESPIRMLIAECENPVTVLSAISLAKQFGVEKFVDISPLFETEEALEHGARIISSLMNTESYRQQVNTRKRLCVQTGFSDAGRFIGQIPAALAIERLQVKLARVVKMAMQEDKIDHDVDVLIFDTHGESMGRGAHPSSLYDRFNYILSPWVRKKYKDKGINLLHEVSFQGGDGYVLFGNNKLAYITLSEMVLSDFEGLANMAENDTLYDDIDFSRDYFHRIKNYQLHMFDKRDYSLALSAFGTNLLSVAGSRKSKRQFDGASDNRAAPAEMRAIPHNAILQQLGYLINIVSGIGEAVRFDQDRFAEMCRTSDRLSRLIRMVGHAYQLSGIKTLVAYASLFDDAFWVTRPIDNKEVKIKQHCLYLADLLRGDSRHDGIMHLATYLREDDVHLQDVLEKLNVQEVLKNITLDESESENHRKARMEELDLLHALRIALIQHVYLLAARIPRFSSSNDISREDVMKQVISLQIDSAVYQLREAYPISAPNRDDFEALLEKATYESKEEGNYGEINHKLIEPIEDTYNIILQLGIEIAHHFRAHG